MNKTTIKSILTNDGSKKLSPFEESVFSYMFDDGEFDGECCYQNISDIKEYFAEICNSVRKYMNCNSTVLRAYMDCMH